MANLVEIVKIILAVLTILGIPLGTESCWHNYNANGVTYALCTDSIPQQMAQDNCTGQNKILAILSEPLVFNYWLKYLKVNLTYNNIWLGAKCRTDGAFQWDDGRAINTSYLTSMVTNCSDCVLFNTSGVYSLNCSKSRGFMCQTQLNKTTGNTTTGNTTTGNTTTANQSVTTTEYTASSHSTSTEHVTTSQTTSATTWMTSPSTTTELAGNSSQDCWCGCSHTEIPINKTDRDALAASESEKIKVELTVDIETLSKTVRKKTSAKDDRPSAQNIGYTGVALLVSAALLIMLMDANHVIRSVHGVAVKLKPKAT